MRQRYRKLAYALLRVNMGIVFFFYGIGKFFSGLDDVAAGIAERLAGSPVPAALVEPFAYVLPFLEVTIGALLILGLLNRIALVLAGLLLWGLTLGVVLEPDPATAAHNVTYAVVVFVLFWLSEHNYYSLDRLRTRRAHEPASDAS